MLALSAADAVRRFAVIFGVDLIVAVRVPVAAELLCVHAREQVGDKDMLGAAVRTVATRGAGVPE